MSSVVFKILNEMSVEICKFTSIIYSFNDVVYRVFCFIYLGENEEWIYIYCCKKILGLLYGKKLILVDNWKWYWSHYQNN